MPHERTICFVTGTRAEFGLMRSTLRAIDAHPSLRLQIIATGMHLDPAHGETIRQIEAGGWRVDAVVPWGEGDKETRGRGDDSSAEGRGQEEKRGSGDGEMAVATGGAMAGIARALERVGAEVVLVVGDRVEAFAAAAAGHLSGRVVAHVHGGDRAQGQVDDALRHAITKLAHVHFPATRRSARRVRRLGEQRWRIHMAGSPGIDGIVEAAAPWEAVEQTFGHLERRRFALLVLHPVDADEAVERERARDVLEGVLEAGVRQVVVVYPNNDPGAGGIVGYWQERQGDVQDEEKGGRGDDEKRGGGEEASRVVFVRSLERGLFLGLMRDCAFMIGNSSSGIIEAASFRTQVIDVGPRQRGREHGENVRHVKYGRAEVQRAVEMVWGKGRPKRARGQNVYGGGRAGERIAQVLAGLKVDNRLLRKLIDY